MHAGGSQRIRQGRGADQLQRRVHSAGHQVADPTGDLAVVDEAPRVARLAFLALAFPDAGEGPGRTS